MGVYVNGMEMPKSCSDCLFFVDGLYDANDEPCSACLAKIDNSPSGCGYKEIDGIDHTTRRMYYCPLSEVPEPHGRLIDVNDAKSRMIPLSFSVQKWIDEVELSNCKTVIEAEGNE